jgi:hypothetical protein
VVKHVLKKSFFLNKMCKICDDSEYSKCQECKYIPSAKNVNIEKLKRAFIRKCLSQLTKSNQEARRKETSRLSLSLASGMPLLFGVMIL